MQIAWIHGFNSTSRTFKFLIDTLPSHDVIAISYDSHGPLDLSIAAVQRQLPKKKFAIIGHSLGGIIGTVLAAQNAEIVTHLVAISAPLAGSKAASTLQWLPGYPKVLSDITPKSKRIVEIAGLKFTPPPVLSIISTGGHLNTSNEPNDGVVTVASQKALKFGKKVEIKANHFEILLHDKTAQHLQDFLFDEENA